MTVRKMKARRAGGTQAGLPLPTGYGQERDAISQMATRPQGRLRNSLLLAGATYPAQYSLSGMASPKLCAVIYAIMTTRQDSVPFHWEDLPHFCNPPWLGETPHLQALRRFWDSFCFNPYHLLL